MKILLINTVNLEANGISTFIINMAKQLVNKNLDEWSIYVGIPCKKIKNREKGCLELEKQLVSYK